ncbi:MAG: RNA polymerase sigma factor [Gemmatimonadaceae bacterium]
MPSDPSIVDTPASAEFEAAMLGCLEPVMRYARALTRDASDADDLVQETFLRALRAWKTFDMSSDPRRWLFAICRHAFLRTRQREMRVVSVDEELELDALAAVSLHKSARDEGLDRVFERVDLRPAVTKALSELSDAHRMIVVLVDIEGQGYAEAAEVLQLPIGTVRSRLFRARRHLQTALVEFARDAGYKLPSSGNTTAPTPDDGSALTSQKDVQSK